MIRNQCSYDNVNAVVCDPGSHTFRIGFARHHHPNVEVSAMVGVPVAALDPGVKPDGRINDRAPVPYCVDVTSLCTPLEGEFPSSRVVVDPVGERGLYPRAVSISVEVQLLCTQHNAFT